MERVQAACSKRAAAPRSDGAPDYSQVAFPGDAGSESEQQLGGERARCSKQENLTAIAEGRVAKEGTEIENLII